MNHEASVFLTLGLALWVGVMTLALARYFKVTPLLFYVLAGVFMGPMGMGWISPRNLGSGLSVLVEFGLAIMLFEGALSLPRSTGLPRSTRRLLVVGMPLTAVLGAVAAHYLGGLAWLPAAVFGALVVVTGPTTIGPLLRSLSISRRLEILLKNEAIWGDCLGILLTGAVMPFWLAAESHSWASLPLALLEKAALALGLGIVIGVALGKIILPALARVGDVELPGMVSLACALLAFAAGQALSPGSGPIASAVAGFTLALTDSPYVREIRAFKGQLASLFIAMFFVLLAALFDIEAVPGDFTSLLTTAIVLGVIVRPVSLGAAFWKTELSWRERAYSGLIGPRGIIALAAASFVATQRPDDPQSARVFALTFVVIVLSGAFATVMGGPLAWLLKVRVPEEKTGIVVAGITDFSLRLAVVLARHVPVRLVDSDETKVEKVIAPGVEASVGDALNEELYQELAEVGFNRVLACAPNDALNTMILEHAEHVFGPNRVFQVRQSADKGFLSRTPHAARRLAFGADFFAESLAAGGAEYELRESRPDEELEIPLVSLRGGGARILRAGAREPGPCIGIAPGGPLKAPRGTDGRS